MKNLTIALGGALAFVLWRTGVVRFDLRPLGATKVAEAAQDSGEDGGVEVEVETRCAYCGLDYPIEEAARASWVMLTFNVQSDTDPILACSEAHLERWMLYGRPE